MQSLVQVAATTEKIAIVDVLDLEHHDQFRARRLAIRDEALTFSPPRPGTYFLRLWHSDEAASEQGRAGVEVAINGKRVVPLALAEQPYTDLRVCWPDLATGSNSMRLVDAGSGARFKPGDLLGMVELGVVEDTLWSLLTQQPFGTLEVLAGASEPAGEPGFVQRPASYVNFFFEVPPAAELRLGSRLPGARVVRGGLIQVDVMSRSGSYRKLLEVNHGEEVHSRLPLADLAGEIVRLSFRNFALRRYGSRRTEVTWIDPKVVAPKPVAPAKAEPHGITPARDERNVVLIVLDALNAAHLGSYGYPRDTTPVLDAVADEGILFEAAYAQGANTNISVASMFTSLYPETTRVWGYDMALDSRAVTLAEILRDQGFATTLVTDHPGLRIANLVQGFDDEMVLDSGSGQGRPAFFDQTVEALERLPPATPGRFLYVHLLAPHSPYSSPEPFMSKFDTGYTGTITGSQSILTAANRGELELSQSDLAHLCSLYDGKLAWIDHVVGRFLEALDASGLGEQSLVIITADHGEGMMEHGSLFHNNFVYEEAIHVPLIMRFPASLEVLPRRLDDPVELVDLVPTILDYLRIDHNGEKLHGISLLPLIAGASGHAKELVFSRSHGRRFSFAARVGRHKLIVKDVGSAGERCDELYDLELDPGELQSLAHSDPVLAGFLRAKSFAWIADQWQSSDGLARAKVHSTEETRQLKALGYLE